MKFAEYIHAPEGMNSDCNDPMIFPLLIIMGQDTTHQYVVSTNRLVAVSRTLGLGFYRNNNANCSY